jgi:ubiquinone biosynthesis protein Coq4
MCLCGSLHGAWIAIYVWSSPAGGKDMDRSAFVDAAMNASPLDAVREQAALLKAEMWTASAEKRLSLAAPFAHAAFLAPERIAAVYDAACEGWFGAPIRGAEIKVETVPPIAPDPALWPAYWAVVDDALAGKLDAASITARTADLGAFLNEGYRARAAAAAFAYPHVAAESSGALPSRISLSELAACPAGSLGAQFHDLIVDNKFDLEVLDRDALGLSALPKPLDWLNTRILQAHDLWHIVAGYETTALHEIALSGFQMAQFGHNYSAHFLAVTAAITAHAPAEGWGLVMDVILSAWKHGRETPSLIPVPWEEVWSGTVEEIRTRYAITPFQSPYPANLFEQMQQAA